MGALVTLDLPADSPVLTMPWIITFGPLSDEEQWEPVVVGPYERAHALALAEEVVADEELMAVVEPVLPYTSVEEIRAEIAVSMAAAEDEDDSVADSDLDADFDEDELAGDELAGDELAEPDEPEHSSPPSPEEIRAGFVRIAARLTTPPAEGPSISDGPSAG